MPFDKYIRMVGARKLTWYNIDFYEHYDSDPKNAEN